MWQEAQCDDAEGHIQNGLNWSQHNVGDCPTDTLLHMKPYHHRTYHLFDREKGYCWQRNIYNVMSIRQLQILVYDTHWCPDEAISPNHSESLEFRNFSYSLPTLSDSPVTTCCPSLHVSYVFCNRPFCQPAAFREPSFSFCRTVSKYITLSPLSLMQLDVKAARRNLPFRPQWCTSCFALPSAHNCLSF